MLVQHMKTGRSRVGSSCTCVWEGGDPRGKAVCLAMHLLQHAHARGDAMEARRKTEWRRLEEMSPSCVPPVQVPFSVSCLVDD